MSKNGWYACIIVLIVVSCACVFCLMVSLIGIAGYRSISSTLSVNFPFLPTDVGSSTPTPHVIRPTSQADASTPTSSSDPTASQSQLTTSVPEATSVPVVVFTDTLNTLENTFIPINDPIELAQRLLGLDNISPTEAPPASFYTVGDQQAFWVGNGDMDNFRVKATLRYVTDHAYFWIEDGVSYNARDLRDWADAFEYQIYPTDRSFFGSEWTPGVDGDPHIYILYARGIGADNAGYFSSADEFPRQVNRFSNAHEMFLVNADNSPLDNRYTYGILAHEFQHMIHWYQDRNESGWVSEGFSELAVLLNDYYSGGFDAIYTSQPDLQLNDWPDASLEDTTPHYGAGFLFFTYFLDRFGETATKALVANQDNDLNSVDSTLRQINAIDPQTGKPITADAFFRDWAVTNYVMDSKVGDGRYAYTRYQGTPKAEPTETVNSCPLENVTRDVHQYGVDYIRFKCPGSYTIHFEGSIFEGSIQTSLLPEDPHSGSFAFWSNKSDESDTTLTKTFDLTGRSGPLTFSYWTWYDIENGWDYVYLEASTDGVNWHTLTTPSGTSANPQGTSYGWGYTGASGGGSSPAWVHETVDLSQFAGHNLSLRFEYVTDSNVTGEGFLLDDLSIPEIGYATNFEANDSGWQPEGWARIKNVLPQTYSLALISVGDTTTVQNITLQPNITADIPFTIGSDVDNVILVVSGTTRFTRQLAHYSYSVTKP
jgi:immune inhibitor A